MPVPPPHRLNVSRGRFALLNFRPRALTELLLNFLHSNLQRLRSVRFGGTRIGTRGLAVEGELKIKLPVTAKSAPSERASERSLGRFELLDPELMKVLLGAV